MNLYAYRDTRRGRWEPNGKDSRPIVFFIKAKLDSQADGAFEKDQGAPWDDMYYIARCVTQVKESKVRRVDKTWGGARVW